MASRSSEYLPPNKRRKFGNVKTCEPLHPSQSSDQSTSAMKVYVRVRPPNEREISEVYRSVLKVVDTKMLVFDPKEEEEQFFFRGVQQKGRDMTKKQRKEIDFLFDGVFDTDSTNIDVHIKTTRSIISSLLEGYNCSVFVYGATGSGKTHTMLGSRENPGIMYHTMVELYNQIDKVKADRNCHVGVTFVEVYNENVHNLLSPSGPMHLRENATGVTIAGLKVEDIFNADHLLEKLAEGNRNRTQHPTDANAESSRSHAVFQVYVRMAAKQGNQVKIVKLSMIDLAGSERGVVTGCRGMRFKEGANINKSLLALGNCISNLADGLKHIPYRDSKLTRLLKDSLGGNCHTIMIANVSPSVASYEDTYNTLKYATRAKKIKTKVTKNVMSVDLHVSHYMKLVEELKKEIVLLKSQARAHDSARSSARNSDSSVWSIPLDEIFEERLELQKSQLSLQCNEKILMWRLKRKHLLASMLRDTPGNKAQGIEKVEESVRQFEARTKAIKSKLSDLEIRLENNDEKLQKLFSEMNEAKLGQEIDEELRMRDDKIDSALNVIKLDYIKKLFLMEQKQTETDMHSIETLFTSFSQYYNILYGLNLVTDKMESQFQNSRNMIEGIKSITWENLGEVDETEKNPSNIFVSFDTNVNSMKSFQSLSKRAKPIPLSLDEDEDQDETPAPLEGGSDINGITSSSNYEPELTEPSVFETPTKLQVNETIVLHSNVENELTSLTNENLNETITLESNNAMFEKPEPPKEKLVKRKGVIVPKIKNDLNKPKSKIGINKENLQIQKLFKKPLQSQGLKSLRTALAQNPVNIRALDNSNLVNAKPKSIKTSSMKVVRSKTRITVHPYKPNVTNSIKK